MTLAEWLFIWAFSFSIFHLMFEIFVTFRSKHSNNPDECLLFLFMCDLADFTDMCVYVALQTLMSVRRSMEDVSKHASTPPALITASAAKASACTPMAGPVLVRSEPKNLLTPIISTSAHCILHFAVLMGICKHLLGDREMMQVTEGSLGDFDETHVNTETCCENRKQLSGPLNLLLQVQITSLFFLNFTFLYNMFWARFPSEAL